MKRIKHKVICALACAMFLLPFGEAGRGFAQNYPIQITAQLATPFSGFIPDYSTPGNENLKLLVFFTDFTKPSYNIKLKLKITGQGITIQSKNYYYYGPVSVQPGIPLEIGGSDLAGLLNPSNLDFSGITAQHYQNNTLPEGYYNICFTAYDYNNPVPIQVSNQSCAFGCMVLSDPPFLNLPQCESTAAVATPQNLMFQWTAMNLSSPNSFNNTLYDFELYEMHPSTQSPGNVIQTLPPIYQTTTSFTFVNYGITEPQLYVGTKYVWRVRARDQSNRDVFKNQGYSQLCTFTYGNTLSQLDSNSLKLTLQGSALTYRLAKYNWDSLSIYTSYQLQYRKQGTSNWFPVYTIIRTSTVNNLEPENTYEARVKGISADGDGPWSNIVTITTPAKPIIACGQGGVPPLAANFIPLTTGKTSQTWNIGQFDMLVTQLDNPNNPTGKYSGYGKITIPFMLGLNLRGKFTDISVNDAMEVVQGEVEIISNGIDAWTEETLMNNLEEINYTYNGDVDSIYVDGNGSVVIIDENGTTTTQTPNNFPYVVQDSNGDKFTINADGSVTHQTGIPQINLSPDQKEVYRMALNKLRNDFPLSTISQLFQQKQQKETSLNNYLTNTTGIDVSQLPTTNNADDVILTADNGTVSDYIPSSPEIDYKTTEFNYLLAKVCNFFSKSTLINGDYNLLANYIIINSKQSYQYIADELQNGTTKDEIADTVKTEIKLFIEKTIKEYTFAKPN